MKVCTIFGVCSIQLRKEKCPPVRRSSRDDFELYSSGSRRNWLASGAHTQPRQITPKQTCKKKHARQFAK